MTTLRLDKRNKEIDGDLDADTDADEPERPGRHSWRPRLLWSTLGVAVVAGAGIGYWVVTRGDGADAASEPSGPAATAEVTRETISATETFGGTLGHGGQYTVMTSGQGTITGLVEQDAEVTRGTELYRLNEQPVTAMYGAIPMYRDLKAGDTGVDVEQLETNLAELGYDELTVDDEFTWRTEIAVQEWQSDLGAEETGVVAQPDVVFVPEGGRVDLLHTDVGGTVTPGSAVLDVTGSDQVVSLDVEVEDRELLEVDTEVTVQLPAGGTVDGTVTATDVVPGDSDSSDDEGMGGGDDEAAGSEDAIVQVEVALAEEADESLLGSPVDVVLDVDEREDVLVVPVNALLALADGGYGLEVVADDGTTSTVEVETGLFADGEVEIEEAAGIDEGTVVGVAGR